MSDETTPQDDAAMSPASAGSVEPVAWAVMSGSDIVYDIYDVEGEAVAICLWLRDEEDDGSWVTMPLYPKQPQPTLTDSERKALETAVRMAGDPSPITAPQVFEYAATLRGLMERLG